MDYRGGTSRPPPPWREQMDAKLRAFLASHGVSEEALDALERGDAPTGPDVLRKGADDSPLAKIALCNALVAEIKQRLDRIERADVSRNALVKGVEMNGVKHAAATALSKGQ